jgi:acyl-coenzyme A synthetase/AMP-(fatty) acid ligase
MRGQSTYPLHSEMKALSSNFHISRVISDHGVKGMFVAPTALRAIKKVDEYANEGKNYDVTG